MRFKVVILLVVLSGLFPVNGFTQDNPIYEILENSNPTSRDVVSKKPIGNYEYVITYKYSIDMNAFDPGKGYKPVYDYMKLELGENISRYYSISADIRDSIMYRSRIANPNKAVDLRGWMENGRIAIYDDYYKFGSKRNQQLVRMGIWDTEYEYSENLPNFNWSIHTDTLRIICGYKCIAAETEFRGRRYVVWFSIDLPFNDGPWKFHGLPGLILAAYESNGIFSWEAVGISLSHGAIHIYDPEFNNYGRNVPLMKIRKISKQEAGKLIRRKWSDPYGFLLESGTKVSISRITNDGIQDITINASNREKFALPEIPSLEIE